MALFKSFNSSNSKRWLSSLLSYFMSIKSIDDNIESLRLALCYQNDFFPNQLFHYLDRKNKDFLLLNDFVKFLKELQIPFEEKYLRQVIHNFDKDNDFSLNFPEFLGLILPKKNNDLKNKILFNRNNNSYLSDFISTNTKNIFGKLLCEELELVKNCTQTAKYCRGSIGFTIYESFIEIAGNDKYITENHLFNFLKKNNINISNNDMHQLMFRLDADNGGRISFNEFEEIFFPMKEGELTYKSNYYEEERNNNYNYYTIDSLSRTKPIKIKKAIPKISYKKKIIDFTFGQNQNFNYENQPNGSINGFKKYNLYSINDSSNNSLKLKFDKNYDLSKTENIIKTYNDKLHPSINEPINLGNYNINNINKANTITNNDYSTTYNSISKSKNNNYNFISPFQTFTLRQSNLYYKSPKIKNTKSPLHYDYSSFSDEDGDEFFRIRKIRENAKDDNFRNFRIFKEEEKPMIEKIENSNLKYENNNSTKPCCGCLIFDNLCPCSTSSKSFDNCLCPKNPNNTINYKSSYKTNINEETKNSSDAFGGSLSSKLYKSKSQYNFFYDKRGNENMINERKFDEKRLYNYIKK